jgi:hypothetical protein
MNEERTSENNLFRNVTVAKITLLFQPIGNVSMKNYHIIYPYIHTDSIYTF